VFRKASRLALGFVVVSFGCASTPRQPPGKPPTPASITREDPGGDAHDPEEAALRRQLELPWGWRTDKDRQLIVPLVDHGNYKRVRYWIFDHFVGFRYGKEYLVMNAAFVQDVPEGEPIDGPSCMRRAEKWSRPQLKSFQVKLGAPSVVQQEWRGQPILVKTMDGYVDFGLKRRRFSGAFAAYPAYPRACLVFGVAVPWGEHGDLAKQVRDRWVAEGVHRIKPLTKDRPHRKED
jgi:hypothetical protein